MRKGGKYGVAPKSERTDSDGTVFHSKAELRRWKNLQLLEKYGKITDLQRQVIFPLAINGIKICSYAADFVYHEPDGVKGYSQIVEDTKGVVTPEFKIKTKLMLAIHGIEIRLTK